MRYELYRMIEKKQPFYIFDLEAEDLDAIRQYQKEHRKIKRWIIIDNMPFLGRLDHKQLGYDGYTNLKEVRRRIECCKYVKYIQTAEDGATLSLMVEKAKKEAKNDTDYLLENSVFLSTADYSTIISRLGD